MTEQPNNETAHLLKEVKNPKDIENGNQRLSSSSHHDEIITTKDNPEHMTTAEATSLALIALCYTCVVSSSTIIIGGSGVAILYVGGSSQITPLAVSSFFIGSAIVSLLTAPVFEKFGRRIGFLFGCVLGVVGAILGCTGIVIKSPVLVILSNLPVGMANGVGLHLRFASMEVVPESFKAFAATIVLTGGCIAAFAGPESMGMTKDAFGPNLTYIGMFVMIGIFNVIESALMSFVKFDSRSGPAKGAHTNKDKNASYEAIENKKEEVQTPSLRETMMTPTFMGAAALSGLAWAIMGMPMSIVRVAMSSLGYKSRLSLTTLEFHFLGMFAPGFVTGGMIKKHGPTNMGWVGLIVFLLALSSNLISQSQVDGTVITWMVGLAFLGVGWNITFTSGTIMLADTYTNKARNFATKIQALNDFFMFVFAGGFIISTGYIYKWGGEGLDGWKILNFSVMALIGVLLLTLLLLGMSGRSSLGQK